MPSPRTAADIWAWVGLVWCNVVDGWMDGSMDEYWMDIDGSIVQDEGGDKRETFVLWLLQDAL